MGLFPMIFCQVASGIFTCCIFPLTFLPMAFSALAFLPHTLKTKYVRKACRFKWQIVAIYIHLKLCNNDNDNNNNNNNKINKNEIKK